MSRSLVRNDLDPATQLVISDLENSIRKCQMSSHRTLMTGWSGINHDHEKSRKFSSHNSSNYKFIYLLLALLLLSVAHISTRLIKRLL